MLSSSHSTADEEMEQQDEKTWTRSLTFVSAEAIAYFNETTVTSRYHKAGRDVTNPRTGRLLSSNCKKGGCRCEHRVRIPKIVTVSQPVYLEIACQCNHTSADDEDIEDEDDDEDRIHDRKSKALLPAKTRSPAVAPVLSLTMTHASTPEKSQQPLLQDEIPVSSSEVPLSLAQVVTADALNGISTTAAGEIHDTNDKNNHSSRHRKGLGPGSGLEAESDELMNEDENEETDVMDEASLVGVIKPTDVDVSAPVTVAELTNNGMVICLTNPCQPYPNPDRNEN